MCAQAFWFKISLSDGALLKSVQLASEVAETQVFTLRKASEVAETQVPRLRTAIQRHVAVGAPVAFQCLARVVAVPNTS